MFPKSPYPAFLKIGDGMKKQDKWETRPRVAADPSRPVAGVNPALSIPAILA
jgi:hypothetical protein